MKSRVWARVLFRIPGIRPEPAVVPLALVLIMGSPRPALRAEDSVSTSYESYSESGGRVGVRTLGMAFSQDLGADMHFGLTLINDAIAGASPTGAPAPAGSDQVPLAHLSDHRKAWEADLSRQFARVSIAAGFSESREHDYISKGWSLNTLTDFNEKNTTLLAGVAGHDDSVETFFDPEHLYARKHAFSAIVGLRQLLDPRTSVSLNVTWGRETGYLDDQYKVVQKTVELIPGSFFPLVFAENRPGERNMGVVYASMNRAYPAVDGALEASYRFYADTYGVTANTVELRWIQKVGAHVTLSPDLRLYRQCAANFYSYNLDTVAVVPTYVPNPSGPAYSSDYRLSALDDVTVGIKATWKPRSAIELQVSYDRFTMRGRDGVTPASAYPVAGIVSVGATLSW